MSQFTMAFTPEKLAEAWHVFLTEFPLGLWETVYVTLLATLFAIVLGLPLNMNGSEGPRVARTRAFSEELKKRTAVPVTFWDERLSTKSAEAVLIEAGTRRERRREVVDKLAAQQILQNYLDAQGGLAGLGGLGEADGDGEVWAGWEEEP